MKRYSFVIIVPIGSKHEHHNFGVMNLIDKSMLSGDTPTPFTDTITREWFWLTSTSTRMLSKFCFQLQKLIKGFGLFPLQFPRIFNGLSLISNLVCHYPTLSRRSSNVSPSLSSYEGPFFASSIRAKNSSLENNVGSFFFNGLEMVTPLIAPSICFKLGIKLTSSTLRTICVITLIILISEGKITINN